MLTPQASVTASTCIYMCAVCCFFSMCRCVLLPLFGVLVVVLHCSIWSCICARVCVLCGYLETHTNLWAMLLVHCRSMLLLTSFLALSLFLFCSLHISVWLHAQTAETLRQGISRCVSCANNTWYWYWVNAVLLFFCFLPHSIIVIYLSPPNFLPLFFISEHLHFSSGVAYNVLWHTICCVMSWPLPRHCA